MRPVIAGLIFGTRPGALIDHRIVLLCSVGGEKVRATLASETNSDEISRRATLMPARFPTRQGCVDRKQLEADEELAREAARYLWLEVLPFTTSEVKRGMVCPRDSSELVRALHSAGINLRYLGRLAAMAMSEEMEDMA